MKPIFRPRRHARRRFPERAAAAIDRFTGAAAPHVMLLILALIAAILFQRIG